MGLEAVLLFISLFVFSSMRLSLYCMFYQQEEYDDIRFVPFIFKGFKLIDKIVSLSVLIALFVLPSILPAILLAGAVRDFVTLKTSKKKLVFTKRVQRILAVATFVMIISSIAILDSQFWVLFLIQAQPFFLMIGNFLLRPYERYVQSYYYKQAVSKLQELSPEIIGMTGSYGKTSVKHILAHILGQAVPTLATPGSVNTVMGITRVIREKLESSHRFFLVEMGAYGVGSIKRLCDFCPPNHGLLTAVGLAHYERFKSVEMVAQAKFELFQAVCDKGGFFIVNLDQVDQHFIDQYASDYKGLITISTQGQEADFKVVSSQVTLNGLEMEIVYDEHKTLIQTPLFGTHHVSNIVQAFALGVKLGVPVSTLQAAFKTVPQITHRLEVKKDAHGPIIIDDAYNANPEGFSSALEVLALLKEERKGKKILVTPGMVELGALHDEKHYELGLKAAETADHILVVKSERIPTFVKALEQKGASYDVYESFALARAWLQENVTINDVILYENDLPDLYENKLIL